MGSKLWSRYTAWKRVSMCPPAAEGDADANEDDAPLADLIIFATGGEPSCGRKSNDRPVVVVVVRSTDIGATREPQPLAGGVHRTMMDVPDAGTPVFFFSCFVQQQRSDDHCKHASPRSFKTK